MKKIFFIFSLFLSACSTSLSLTESQTLPFDDNILRGRLDNGLKYYILPNNQPAERVYIRLVVNAGSMHEDNDQRGVAHIVEHMAFNGTTNYPENTIIDALEQLGIKFARDINAFTDFENTVYTLNLAKNDFNKLDLAFDVLNEWMNNVTIFPKDLDAERGIVLEEWRARLSPMLRLGDKKSAVEMQGSRYVLRDPIGDVDVIKNVSASRVKDFYQKWYRPDNMSLIVVGDINASEIKKLVKTKLSKKNVQSATKLLQPDYRIPLINHWRLSTLSEKGINVPTIELSFLRDIHSTETVAEYKKEFIQQMIIRLINLRLQQWEKQQQSISSGNFYQTYLGKFSLQNMFSLQLTDTNYQEVINQLFEFIAQIHKFGFTEQEFQEEIQRLTELNEKQLVIKAGSLKLADDLIPVVANNQVSLSSQDKYQLNRQILSQLKLVDLNHAFNEIIELKAKLLLVTQPYPDKKLNFTVTNIEQAWQKIMSSSLTQYNQQESAVKGLPILDLKPATVKKEKYHSKGNITEFRLANGSSLIYHYSDKQPNQVYFKALTTGGLRSIPRDEYHLLRTAVALVDETGIGNAPQAEINHTLSHSPVVFSTLVDDYQQGFVGVGKSTDLGTILHLFRLKLQAAPISSKVWSKYKQETKQYFDQMDRETSFMRLVAKQRYPQSETIYSQNEGILQQSPQKLTALYQSKINDKTDFTYFIVGDIAENKVKVLAEKYLANLSVKKQERSLFPLKLAVPNHQIKMKGLLEPRAEVEIYLTAQNQWQPENDYLFDVLADIIQDKLRIRLREKESGIYSVNTWLSQDPKMSQLEGRISFSCAPERVDQLIKSAHNILDEIMQEGVEADVVAKKLNEKHTQIKQQFDSLLYVLDRIEQSYRLDGSPRLIYLYQQLDKIVTKQNLDRIAKKALNPQGRFEAILMK